MSRSKLSFVAVLAFALALPAASRAQSSQNLIAYQGVLDLDGAPQSGSFDFIFEIYSSDTAGECETPTAECLWSDSFAGVGIYAGRFAVLLGSGAPLADSVWQHDAVYVAVKVKRTSDVDYTPLARRKRIVAVPYSARAATAKNYHVTGTLVVDGPIQGHAITPSYQGWDSQGTGEGGAAIYNDAVNYKTLMIVGNTSGGGVRAVGLWDDVSVARDLRVNRNLAVTGNLDVDGTVTRSGCHWVGFAYTHVSNPQYSCPEGEYVVGIQTKYYSDYVDVYPGAMQCCKIGS